MKRLKGHQSVFVSGVLMVGCVLIAGVGFAVTGDQGDPTHTIRLIVDYNDGVQKHFTAIPWKKGMTVLQAMHAAEACPHGIKVEIDNDSPGPRAMLQKIDDLRNQGGGPGKRNWLYWVNTEFGNTGLGVCVLQPSDVVLWKFEQYKPRK